MSKRTVTLLLCIGAVSFFLANVSLRLSAMTPVQAAQAGGTAAPSRTPRLRPQATATLGQAIVIIEKDTQLFAQPDNTSEILFALPRTGNSNNFARLLAVTTDYLWYQIEIGNNIGWVFRSAARIVDSPIGMYSFATLMSTPGITGATPTLAPLATERMVGAHPIIHFTGRVDVYPEPSTFVPSIGIIMPGQSAEVLARASSFFDYYLVRYDNGAGWIWDGFSGDVQGDTTILLLLTVAQEPTADYSYFFAQSPTDIESFLASPTPAPPGAVSPTQVSGPAHVADTIDMLLEPAVPLGSYTPEQLAAAAETVRARIAQYPVSDYSVEVDAAFNTIHVRFADTYYREEIISLVQQEGLFEAVNFSDQSVELRAALLFETILTSGYSKRESERIRHMTETYNTNSSVDLAAHGFTFSNRRRNILENKPFPAMFDDQSVAGASMVQGRNLWDAVVTLTDEGAERYSSYPLNSFIAFTMDGTILSIPLATDVIPSPFTLTLHTEENQARMLVVLLRSRSLPFALRARQITYLNNS